MSVVVKCKYPYLPPVGNQGKGQLALERGDLLLVDESMPDTKWAYGRRLRDGTKGWFPRNYCKDMEPAEAIRVLREAGIAVPKTEASSAASFAANSSHREMDASKVSTEDPDLAADLHTSAPTVPRSLPGREQQQPGSGEQYWRYRCADLQTELDALRERHERYRQEMTEALALEMQRREYAESKLRNLSARFESIDSSEPLQENRLNVSAPPPSQASPARLSRNDPLASPEFVSKLSVRERQRLFMERVASMEPRRP